ncbi:MAG TPA: FecR family protein, partial [Flavisolibacter sp.]|nr:FecR family protein [Flavisolibacter sp.]
VSLINIAMDQNNYRDFLMEDFVWDDYFRKWVLAPNAESDFFWHNWISENPEKEHLISSAREIVSSLKVKNEVPVSEEEINILVQDTLSKLMVQQLQSTGKSNAPVKVKSVNRSGIRWAVAASFIILTGVGSWLWLMKADVREVVSYEEVVQLTNDALTEEVNSGANTVLIHLDDGTTVKLEPKARISYPAYFANTSQREIYLSGSATFQVAKDPNKPFLVYANGLVTKVIGTSFKILSSENNKEVTVEVLSGIVSVFPYTAAKKEIQINTRKNLILTRNQKASYSIEDKNLIASIVDKPVLKDMKRLNYNFVDVPVDEVFKSIKNGYGIDIIYDEKALGSCTITANLQNTTLHQKVDVISRIMAGKYEIIDGKIIIYSNGCTEKSNETNE